MAWITVPRMSFQLRVALEERPNAPDYWRRDVLAFLNGPNMDLSKSAIAAGLADASLVRDTLEAYGHALQVWPALWEACADRH